MFEGMHMLPLCSSSFKKAKHKVNRVGRRTFAIGDLGKISYWRKSVQNIITTTSNFLFLQQNDNQTNNNR